jgi:hypothetical protein
MKKVLWIIAIATLVACGSASTEATTGTATTTIDSAAVVVTDSTAAGTATPTIEKELPEAVK